MTKCLTENYLECICVLEAGHEGDHECSCGRAFEALANASKGDES